jgi:hypothetical protein
MPTETATADPQQSTSIFDEPEVEETESAAGEESGTSTVEEVEATEGAEPTLEADPTEEDTAYLPSEQSKVFPVEELARYGKRYGYTLDDIQADPRLQNALKDKINSDILIQQQKDAEAAAQTEEEPSLQEEQVEEPQLDPSEARAQWFKNVEQFVDQTTDPEIAKEFAKELSSVQDAKGQIDPIKITRAFSKFGVNLINTALPALLPQMLSAIYPQLGDVIAQHVDQANRPVYNAQWDAVKASNPEFKDLPQFGTPEFKEWSWATAKKIPNFDKMFSDLPLEQAAHSKYVLLAQIGLGQRVTPAIVKQAAETGKRQAAESQKKKLAGNLGAGQSKGQIAAKKTGNSGHLR